jgi:RNA polymerase sigma factor (sigma-70 family)
MSAGPPHHLLQYLRRATAPGEAAGVADAQLLQRFAVQHDEAAFELLVWRHGRMVLGVCGRLLRNPQDVEDCYQAAFLALARRAAALGKQPSVGGWLYRVAYRAALAVRAQAARRAARERPLADLAEAAAACDPSFEAAERELGRAIDAEVQRLPEKYRLPLLLCAFEGRSNAEAARELGCPLGTLESRLSRARSRLRAGLARRGFPLAAGALADALSRAAAEACPPVPPAAATAAAALRASAGAELTSDLVSARVVALTEGVLQSMIVAKLKAATGICLAVLAVIVVAGLLAYRGLAGPPPRGEGASAPRGSDRKKARGADRAEEPKRQKAEPMVEWSKAVNGLQGRLVRQPRPKVNGTEIIAIAVELRNVSTDPLALQNDPASVRLTLHDATGKSIPGGGLPRSGPIPAPQWGTIPRDSYLGFGLYDYGAGVPRGQGALLAVLHGKDWLLKPGKYFLRGTFTVRKAVAWPKNPWVGQLHLPPLEIEVR